MKKVPDRLLRIKRSVERELMSRPGVVGVDVGYKETGGVKTDKVAIRVLVREKKDVPPSERIPSSIQGFPTDVIERKFKLHVDTTLYNPLKGGCSIGPDRVIDDLTYSGTLGAIVTDRETGEKMALSNFHVMLVDDEGAEGDEIVQPSLSDDGSSSTDVIGTVSRWAIGGSVDCAVALLNDSRDTPLAEIIDVGTVRGTSTAGLGDAVRKRGRTTGLQYGIVDAVDMTVTVDYGDGIGEITLTGQIGIEPVDSEPFSDHGDSGSLVLNSRRQAVGLLFAGNDDGYGVANPIEQVLDELEVDLYVTDTPSTYFSWPETLPLPYIDYQGQPIHPVIASPMTSGKIERRRRFIGRPVDANVGWVFATVEEYEAFKSFFKSDLDNGAATFTIDLRYPKNSELTNWLVRFEGGYEAAYDDGTFTVQALLNLIRLSEPDTIAGRPGTEAFYVVDGSDWVPFYTADNIPYFVNTT